MDDLIKRMVDQTEVLTEGFEKANIQEEQVGDTPKPDAPSTKSQKTGEKEQDLGNVEKQESAPSNDAVGKTPDQKGDLPGNVPATKSQKKASEKVDGKPAEQEGETPKPDAPETKSQKDAKESKVDEEVDGGEDKGPDGEAPKEAPHVDATKTAEDNKQDEIKVDDEQPVSKSGANEKKKEKVKEDKIEEQEPGEEEDLGGEPPSDIPPEGEAPEVELEEPEKPDKEYLGNKEDVHYYIVRDKDDSGNIENIRVVDAEENEVYSAKGKNADADLTDESAVILDAIQDVEIENIAYDLFMEYFFKKLVGEEEIEDPEEEEAGEEAEEEAEEEVGEGKKKPGNRDGTGPADGSYQKKNKKEGKRKEAGEKCPAEEGKVPNPKDATAKKIDDLIEKDEEILNGLIDKYGLNVKEEV